MNEEIGVIDHATEISIVANAVYFGLGVLIAETLKRFSNFDDLPVDEVIQELIIDKGITRDEAVSMLNDFTLRFYQQEIPYETDTDNE